MHGTNSRKNIPCGITEVQADLSACSNFCSQEFEHSSMLQLELWSLIHGDAWLS